MVKGILRAHRLPKVPNEMKCTNENMTCNTQDTILSWYVPKINVDHTIRCQGTSTLDHSATTRSSLSVIYSSTGSVLYL